MMQARAPAVLALLALAACGRSPATTFLAIDPAPPATALVAYHGPPVRVPFLHVPVTLDRPEFAREVAGVIAVSDFDRWAAPLGRLARDAFIQDLQARLPAGAVLPPDASPAVPELRVEATVTRFQASGGEASMDVVYRLVRPAPAQTVLAAVTLHSPLPADTPETESAAWGALLGQLADQIATKAATFR